MDQRYLSKKKPLSIAIKTALVGTTMAMMAYAPVQADEVTEMKQVIKQLQDRLNQVESKQETQTKLVAQNEATETLAQAPFPLVNKEIKTSLAVDNAPREIIRNTNHQVEDRGLGFKLGAGDTKVSVSGYVKLDAFVDSDQDVGDSFVFSSIADSDSPANNRGGSTRFAATQSRLRVKSETELNGKKLKTLIEADFRGAGGNQSFSNSNVFRLRHAWITYGNWGFGQFWSNFQENNFVAYPSTADFFGPVGQSFVRQAQIRYTTGNWSFSLENPETDGNGAAGRLRESTGGQGIDELPDITAAWRGGPGGAGGSYEFGAVYRKLGVEGTLANGNSVDESEDGYGILLAGGWQLGPAYVYAHYNFGEGIGRYIINGAANDIYVEEDGSTTAVQSQGGNIGVTLDVGSKGKLNLVYGFFTNDDERSNGIDTLESIHLGYKHNVGSGLSLSAEVIYGDIERFDGTEGDNTRFQFSAQKNF